MVSVVWCVGMAVFALVLGFAVGYFEGARDMRIEAGNRAAWFSMRPNRSIHPDIPWDQMNDSAKMVAHTTAQQIAVEILEGK